MRLRGCAMSSEPREFDYCTGEHIVSGSRSTTGRGFLNPPGEGGRAFVSVKANGGHDRTEGAHITLRIGDCNNDVNIGLSITSKNNPYEWAREGRRAKHIVETFQAAVDHLRVIVKEVLGE